MAARRARNELPAPVGAGVAVFLLLSLAYALLARQIALWLFFVVSVGLSAYVLFLFYRLVTAVEEIARKL